MTATPAVPVEAAAEGIAVEPVTVEALETVESSPGVAIKMIASEANIADMARPRVARMSQKAGAAEMTNVSCAYASAAKMRSTETTAAEMRSAEMRAAPEVCDASKGRAAAEVSSATKMATTTAKMATTTAKMATTSVATATTAAARKCAVRETQHAKCHAHQQQLR